MSFHKQCFKSTHFLKHHPKGINSFKKKLRYLIFGSKYKLASFVSDHLRIDSAWGQFILEVGTPPRWEITTVMSWNYFNPPPPYLLFVILFTQAKFLENKIYTKKRQFLPILRQFLPIYTEICTEKRQFLPIFRVKSVKIYTGQKKFTRAPPVAPVTNMRYALTPDSHIPRWKPLAQCQIS